MPLIIEQISFFNRSDERDLKQIAQSSQTNKYKRSKYTNDNYYVWIL